MKATNEKELFEKIESVPTELMTELTDKTEAAPEPASIVEDAAKHTTVTPGDAFNALKNVSSSEPTPSFSGPQSTRNASGPQSMNAGGLITGSMAVHFLDIILPAAIVLVVDRVSEKKISKNWLKATPEEKATLEPVLQNYLNSINFAVDNPINALLIAVCFIYGVKTVEALNYNAPAPARTPNAFPNEQKRTRGRHPNSCQCVVCKQRRNKQRS